MKFLDSAVLSAAAFALALAAAPSSALAESHAADENAEAAAAEGEVMDQAAAVAALEADSAAGERVFNRCKTCHVIEAETNRAGPHLVGLIGRPAGIIEGYRYSAANAESGITWTVDVLQEYLVNPRQYLPGTKMAFPGLRSEEDINNVIAYMLEAGGGAYEAPAE